MAEEIVIKGDVWGTSVTLKNKRGTVLSCIAVQPFKAEMKERFSAELAIRYSKRLEFVPLYVMCSYGKTAPNEWFFEIASNPDDIEAAGIDINAERSSRETLTIRTYGRLKFERVDRID